MILIPQGNQNAANLDTRGTSYSIAKVVLLSGNIENPKIEYVIERDIGIYKETIDTIRMVLASGKYADAQQIPENVYGDEYTGICSIGDFQTYVWENGGTKRGNRQESNPRYGEDVSSLNQNQERTNTLTDREVLALAVEGNQKRHGFLPCLLFSAGNHLKN